MELIAACGRSLGKRAALYGTAYAADDLAAILEALGIRRIDLYGDSYGTYFEQVFAVRHPGYPAFHRARRRLSAERHRLCLVPQLCAGHAREIRHRLPALRALRAAARHLDRPHAAGSCRNCARIPFRRAPPTATARSGNSPRMRSQLAIVMFGSAPAFAIGARIRRGGESVLGRRPRAAAAAHGGDRQRRGFARPHRRRDEVERRPGRRRDVPGSAADLRYAPGRPLRRSADRDRAIARRKRDAARTPMRRSPSMNTAACPWTTASSINAWSGRSPRPRIRPRTWSARDSPYPDIPALIISGELDNITTPADGAAVARAFKHGTQIRIANSFHVNALPRARSACGAQIVRRFIETLSVGRYALRGEVPPLRLVPQFALHASDARTGHGGRRQSRRQRAVALGAGRRADGRRRAGAPRRQFHRHGGGAARRQFPHRE